MYLFTGPVGGFDWWGPPCLEHIVYIYIYIYMEGTTLARLAKEVDSSSLLYTAGSEDREGREDWGQTLVKDGKCLKNHVEMSLSISMSLFLFHVIS